LLFLRIMRTAVPSSFLAASLTASLLVGCGVSTSGGNGAGGPVGTQEDPVADPHAPYRLTRGPSHRPENDLEDQHPRRPGARKSSRVEYRAPGPKTGEHFSHPR
jgi:hypothetical protein